MSPPIGSSPFHEVDAGGITVDGEKLPAGCDVGTGIYSIHHNPKYYPEPFVYSPGRWLVSEEYSTQEAVELARSAFTPFSIGPRACIEKGLPMMELMSVLAGILCRFDYKVANGTEGIIGEGRPGAKMGREKAKEFQLYDHVTAAKKGPVLQFRPRSDDKKS